LISQDLVTEIQVYSRQVQKQRDHVVWSTHKQLWTKIHEECVEIVAYHQYAMFWEMTKETFVETLVFHKKIVDNDLTRFIEDIKKKFVDL
jgi:hypothetical protein